MERDTVSQTQSSEDRFLAGLAHALVLTTWVGPIGAAVIYVLTRDRSRFVAFHAAQAAVYQLVTLVLTIIAWVVWTVLYTLSLVPLMVNADAYAEPPWFFWAGLASTVLPLALMALFVLYGLWGAVRAFQGRRFRYVIVGPWLERALLRGQDGV